MLVWREGRETGERERQREPWQSQLLCGQLCFQQSCRVLTERSVNITSGPTPEREETRSGNCECLYSEGPALDREVGKYGAGSAEVELVRLLGWAWLSLKDQGSLTLAFSPTTGKGSSK